MKNTPFGIFVKDVFFALCPVHRNWIVFDSFKGRGFGDSPGAIAGEILKRKLPYRLFWLIEPNDIHSLPKGIIPVKRRSFREKFIAASSHIWIDNVKDTFIWKKKKKQYYIQTWHGGGLPLKEVEGQTEQFLDSDYLVLSKHDSAQTDMVLADNNLIAEIYRKWFWFPSCCEIACTGLPKNDAFYQPCDATQLKLQFFGRKDVKVALYAPTFRDDKSDDGYQVDLPAIHRRLEQKTGDQWIVAVRLHPNIKNRSDELFDFNDCIVNATHYPNPQDLILSSDILITDYSSIMSDFLALDKPVFLLTLDLEHYLAHCRSIGKVFYQLPFTRCSSNEELLRAIDEFNREDYLLSIRKFKQDCFISYDDGHASERVVDRIEQIIGR
jgi:CDP-glycerol glycerophosphotransferase